MFVLEISRGVFAIESLYFGGWVSAHLNSGATLGWVGGGIERMFNRVTCVHRFRAKLGERT